MRNGMLGIVALIHVHLLTGCTPGGLVKVDSVWGGTVVRYEKGATFAWLPSGRSDSQTENAPNPELAELIRTNIEAGLVKLGYAELEASGPPDFWVSYRLSMRPRPGPGMSYKKDLGSLVIEASAPADGHVIWRGTAEALVDESLTPEDRKARIEHAIKQTLKRFAPR